MERYHQSKTGEIAFQLRHLKWGYCCYHVYRPNLPR